MKRLSIFIIILVALAACKQATETSEQSAAPQGLITLSDSQAKSLTIQMGKLEKTVLQESIEARGQLDVPPQNLISIMAPLGGFVKETTMLQGMKVKKGQVMAVLEHPNYIRLQQDYLEKSSQLEYLQTEYKRQETLQVENANALKTAQQAKANYESTLGMVKGLEAMLTLAHISVSELKKGTIQNSIALRAPSDGYVTQVWVNNGRYVQESDILFELVNLEHIHAELKFFEGDIGKIKKGQSVMLYSPGLQEPLQATVYLVGKVISSDRSIQVHCHLAKEDESLIPGSYVTATVSIGEKVGSTLPAAAVVHFDGKDYAFVEISTNQYEAIEVSIIQSSGDKVMIELTDANHANKNFVVEGAFELLGLLKNSGDE